MAAGRAFQAASVTPSPGLMSTGMILANSIHAAINLNRVAPKKKVTKDILKKSASFAKFFMFILGYHGNLLHARRILVRGVIFCQG